MLYKFKSKAAGDVIMLEPNGVKVLSIIGKDSGPTGIILAAQMKAAIAALNAAVAQEEADQKAATAAAQAEGKVAPKLESVSLRQRAHPFIEMLKVCETAGENIVWGV
jgi:Domain of unknown function (DUF1840)